MTFLLPPERHPPESLTGLGAYASIGEAEMNQEKWVLNSLTMWGAFITGLTASLPSLNVFLQYFFDFSIEPDWLTALNDGVKNAIMGVGSIAGLGMVVWGRWNAKAELTAKPK